MALPERRGVQWSAEKSRTGAAQRGNILMSISR